jgi:hypothetical protein
MILRGRAQVGATDLQFEGDSLKPGTVVLGMVVPSPIYQKLVGDPRMG